ncbi:tRNA pseudouridine(55) synthase TruB [Henriciella pelagia]|uniref:tRNA pseudouridine synthase B n=1 Tax=Henriciella pelagia TaxID=1977912 RepID=A0ABQ1JLF8_9PROT|nr:tRNA pseudouridine(55) synthase TruB [Henriciella pelagia]GGB70009.1 tRNA pseudouridine synthase B [Henriciella pelagia]
MARKRKGLPVHGWLNVDKPVDVTSTQVVGILKRLFNAQKCGHGGTLDPLADGILPIAFGEATKTVQWAMDADKEYVFTIEWGRTTSTLDAEGEIVATSDVRPTQDAIEDALEQFEGDIEQVPPKYSAIKVDGERAYDLARDGEEFEIPSRKVTVYEARLLEIPDVDHAVIHVRSGKGFYVRALARDLAAALGCEGHVSQLRRIRVGVMHEGAAVKLAELEAMESRDDLLKTLAPIEAVLDDVPEVEISAEDAAMIRQGREVMLLPHVVEQWRLEKDPDPDNRIALAMDGDTAVAMGEIRAGRFQPNRVFQMG